MKQVSLTLLIFLILAISTGCADTTGNNAVPGEKSDFDDQAQIQDVSMYVGEESITKEAVALTLVLENKSDEQYVYGEDHHLEINVNNIWYIVPLKEGSAWKAIGYILLPNSVTEIMFKIGAFYEDLVPGDFRIIKRLSGEDESGFVMAYFSIME